MRGGGTRPRGVAEANRQLLLASELTYDRDLARDLAALAHRVGELDEGADPAALARIDDRLGERCRDAHEDVQAAVVRARRLLRSHRERVST